MESLTISSLRQFRLCRKIHKLLYFHSRSYYKATAVSNCEKISSKNVRQLFLDYFTKEKNHTYVHSSSVFLNNDPSLLFVNAGMNQFRSLLLNKVEPNHPFSKLKRVANSQKCIRLSGKHNDLDDVGNDFHHHTFFEMLGNWSFGDYSKKESCEMAWELLTKVYQLSPENLYITYFGGSDILGIPADEECRNIWIDIGVPPSHIFPFVKENFWEMADVGPCGPCTEIHFDFLHSTPDSAAKRINADKPNLIELWNLVFIQYNREQSGFLKLIPELNVDTGMGFERLTAVLQGTMSNYDTDIFTPLFKAIERNFNVPPYEGKTGPFDSDGVDTAYRIIADHSRMFSVSIADGLFPDAYDAGHILRKIIRRASYAANKFMKSRPGVLSSLVPVVADTLDFFPEVNKNIKEIVDIVNEEEKLFHQLINRGRKARNKMMSENSSKVLNGKQVLHLREICGLEDNVVKDLASEVELHVDWEDYKQVSKEKKINENKLFKEKENKLLKIVKLLINNGIKSSDDSYKYNYSTRKNAYGVKSIEASIVGIMFSNQLITEATEGMECLIVTDKTNFYSEAGGQIGDVGNISNKDFTFQVDSVISSNGYVLHKGSVLNGTVKCGYIVEMNVDKDHRLACSQNHTATHLLNSYLKSILPYTTQRSSYVGPSNLRLGFSAKTAFGTEEIETIEENINKIIQQKMKVNRTDMSLHQLIDNPKAVILQGEEYPEFVHVISIGSEENNEIVSIEPCCGTHVHNTSDIEKFIIVPTKSHGGTTRYINAVTGSQASVIDKIGEELKIKVLKLCKKADEITMATEEELKALLKDLKQLLKECHSKQDASLVTLKKCEQLLLNQKLRLEDMLVSYNINEGLMSETSDADIVKPKVPEDVLQLLATKNIPVTYDNHKYDWHSKGDKHVEAKILAVINSNEFVNAVDQGINCQIILDKTNFYAEEDDQAGDVGFIRCKDFIFKVNNVYKVNGYVFHDGYVEQGSVISDKDVQAVIDERHRLSCSQNHTALHLLNAALKEELPYSHQIFAHAGAKDLLLTYSSKVSLTDTNLENIERKINKTVQENLNVLKSIAPVDSSKEFPAYKLSIIKKSKGSIPTISIGKDNEESTLKSIEPCYGTHVNSTADIGTFIITTSKSKNTKEKIIHAVTGNQAQTVNKDGDLYERKMLELENYVSSCLEKENIDYLELWDCLKDVKLAKVYHETDLPVLLFRKHQIILTELSKRLTTITHDFIQQGFKQVALEMQKVLQENSDNLYIIYNLKSLGDGKKIINFALENSNNKPAMYFAKDGHKSIICSCSVPKNLVQPTFSAILWINPVASFLGGRARTLTKDSELFYSVICPKTENVHKAIEIAKQFIDSNYKT